MAEKKRRTVKASLILDVELHARWRAAANLRNMPANAIAVEALTEALKGVVLFDRAKKPERSKDNDRPGMEGVISPDAKDMPSEGRGLTVIPNARPAASKRAAG